jgi:hypothetical protein
MRALMLATSFAALMATSGFAIAATDIDAAKPFGITVGETTCHEVAKTTGGHVQSTADGVIVRAMYPGNLYTGAQDIVATCKSETSHVRQLGIKVAQPDAKSTAPSDAYKLVSEKFKRVAGGPVKARITSYARFSNGDTIVEVLVPASEFDFEVNYFTAAQFAALGTTK